MLLVIETAFAMLSVALLDGEHVGAEVHDHVGRGHAEALMPAVARVVGDAGGAVTGILVDIGPGSFTGLRIGIAAARALGLAWNVPVTGIGSLTLVAAAAFAGSDDLDAVAAAADAGRGQIYWQVFDRGCLPRTSARSAAPMDIVIPEGIALAGSGAAMIGGGHPQTGITHARAADARFVPPGQRALVPAPIYSRGPDMAAA